MSPFYKTSIKAFMAATTQSCSDIERTPSSDREVPHKITWILNFGAKFQKEASGKICQSGLWTMKTSLRPPQYMHGKASLEVDVFDVFHHADLDARVFWVRGTLTSPHPTQCLPWHTITVFLSCLCCGQKYMTIHALSCITYSTSFPVWKWMS